MARVEDKNTRYFIDLDLRTRTIIGWDYGHKFDPSIQKPAQSFVQRVFISKGQYNKIVEKNFKLNQAADEGV